MPELIVALDVEIDKAFEVVDKLGDSQQWYKVGYKLFLPYGVRILEELKNQGKKVFLDLKFHDIPNTMVNAALNVCEMSIEMFNVHISAGRDALLAVRQAIDEWAEQKGKNPPLYIGVTLLTSLSGTVDEVVDMARMAKDCGLNGVVCSVWEVRAVKKACGKKFLCICPGIRFDKNKAADQRRIATPEEAAVEGADYIVIGRAILEQFD